MKKIFLTYNYVNQTAAIVSFIKDE